MKRGISVLLLSLIFISMFSSLVLALSLSDVTNPVKDFLTQWTGNDVVFAKSLFFILILLIIGTIVSRIALFKSNPIVAFLVALVVSVLAIWFIPENIITAITSPYEAMGIAMVSVIPFVLMFLFTRWIITNSFGKKIAWLFFAIIMVALSVGAVVKNAGDLFVWAYGLASILSVAMVFFNSWIDKALWKGEVEAKYTAAERRMQKRLALDRLKEQEAEATFRPRKEL